ncbi:MAG: hypothetical protein ACXADS_10210 [Candidatus Thorarchaeota archaeon]|jgi:hypothetical protein
MADFFQLHKSARHDVRVCLQVWTELLRESQGERLDFAYAKGSSVKKWDSAIDYVPVLSDVDIHVHLTDEEGMFAGEDDPFKCSMELSRTFEERFYEREPEPLHLPRSQVVLLNDALKQERFSPPRLDDIQSIVGQPRFSFTPSPQDIREHDLQNLQELGDFLGTVPMRTLDRAGFDYWSLIRYMTWRVAPTPVRLITQTHDDPMEVWTWNRTRITSELKALGYERLEQHYRGFYEAGWRLFLSQFRGSEDYRGVVTSGYYVLKECWERACS